MSGAPAHRLAIPARCCLTRSRVQLRGLAIGYHLLRAFLVDAEGLCLKSEVAAVAAEFFVVEAVSTGDRCVVRCVRLPRRVAAGGRSVFAPLSWGLCGCTSTTADVPLPGCHKGSSFMFGQPSLCVLQPWGALTSIEVRSPSGAGVPPARGCAGDAALTPTRAEGRPAPL